MMGKLELAIAAGLLFYVPAALAQNAAPPPGNPSPPQAAPAPPTPVLFDDAVTKAANDLLSKAKIDPNAAGKINLLIDPLIDGVTGAQSAATQSMGRRIVELVQSSYPKFQIKPFTSTELEKKPIVLIGTFTPVNNAGVPNGAKDAYRICLALADLGSKTIVSKGVARSKFDGVDITPTSYFSDTPMFAKDAATDAYVKSCQGTKPGDPIEKSYVDRISSAALIADAVQAYDAKKYEDALKLYEKASSTPGGDQLRALNGIYLANWRLNRVQASAQAFDRLIGYGLNNDRMAIKFLFKKGTTQFVTARTVSAPYGMWLEKIASQVAKNKTCLDIVGHASPTGRAAFNDTLSLMRAKYIMQRIRTSASVDGSRMKASGVGSSQNIIGTGKDDASDALDRRVEFKVDAACSASNKTI